MFVIWDVFKERMNDEGRENLEAEEAIYGDGRMRNWWL